ncbi:MAG: HlyC/CorC family transporter [Deltaproteobacteria bacterium]|nr:HlyC/CorC family transporter [Deltaproteobacteria bacterium]
MLELLLGSGIIVVCLILEGFFSGTETAIVSIDRARLKALAEKGDSKAPRILALLNNPELFFSTTLLGTNMVAVLSNAIAAYMVITALGQQYEYVTILIMTPLILIFGEIVPKTVYRYHAEQLAPRIISPLQIVSKILSPIIITLTWLTGRFVRLCGIEKINYTPFTTREDLENYLDMWNINSSLKTAERKMIERIFDFSETAVADIMIPLINIRLVDVHDDVETAIRIARKSGHSRLPLYADEAYNIIGIVHTIDLLRAKGKEQNLREIMRPARYVPDSIPIDELLHQMRTEGDTIAVVVNEYGGTIGIVTIEDILEEVVGEIYDEYDKEEHLLVKNGSNSYLVNGRMSIDEINERLKLDLPKDEYETIAGFLLKHLERIPEVGDTFQFHNLSLVVRKADKRSIKQISLSIDNEGTVAEDSDQ